MSSNPATSPAPVSTDPHAASVAPASTSPHSISTTSTAPPVPTNTPEHPSTTPAPPTRVDTPVPPGALAHDAATTLPIEAHPPTSDRPSQAHPASISLPSPSPGNTVILSAPLSPDHVTVQPVVSPLVTVVELSHPASVETPPTRITQPTGDPAHGQTLPEAPHKSVERIDVIADLPAHTAPRSRRNSDTADKTKPTNLVLPTRPSYHRTSSSDGDLRSGLASPIIPHGAVEILIASVRAREDVHEHAALLGLVTLRAGKGIKPFQIHRHLLQTKVPYFTALLAEQPEPSIEQTTFDDLDEYGCALFVRWLYGGELHGPRDFHSFHHYLTLYVLATKFGIEDLQDTTMDLVRAYYRVNSMTAPAYRIEYIYTYTTTANPMRKFLLTTAAYRCLCEAPASPGEYLSGSMKGLLSKPGDVAVDFAEALIRLSKNGLVDVRRGNDEFWHARAGEGVDPTAGMEPWENV